MKNYLLMAVLSLSVASGSAIASDDCRLDHSISIGDASLLDQSLILKNAKFDASPLFAEPNSFDPNQDRLELKFFNLLLSNEPLGILGASISVVGKSESIGFADNRFLNFFAVGSTQVIDGATIYTSRNSVKYTEPQHAKNIAVLEVVAAVQNGHLTSVRLTHPVYKLWKIDNNVKRFAFTGEHQVLCLKSVD